MNVSPLRERLLRVSKSFATILLFSSVWPYFAFADTKADAAAVVNETIQELPSVFCNENFYRACFGGILVQQCQAELAQVLANCKRGVPIASLEQAFDVDDVEAFGSFGQNLGKCALTSHSRLPQYNQANVNACLNSPVFRPETLVPILELILND